VNGIYGEIRGVCVETRKTTEVSKKFQRRLKRKMQEKTQQQEMDLRFFDTDGTTWGDMYILQSCEAGRKDI